MTHPELVEKLVKPPSKILFDLNLRAVNLIHMVMGIGGETGELVDAIKKHTVYGRPLDIQNVIEELGDLEFYMEGLRQELGLSRKQILDANIVKLQKRYSDGYSDKAAHDRADKL